jgi:phosphonate transport system substrate-binding protein
VAGAGTTQAITDLLLGLDAANPQDAEILELFGAKRFIATKNSNYDQIEAVAREQGLLA